ncbi:Transcription factor GRAS [Artemisia annua]|uniref:Transcription factor GRAS n=1 Tax=Artemisia annua TaxID=35608 RepID=A0A2U1KTQ5_ARTAN|nr:Transcription factor GRAS [Artemisia annua]
MLRWIMGDVEDPSIGFNKMLNSGTTVTGPPPDFEFSGGFGVVDQGFMTTHHHQNQMFSSPLSAAETHLVSSPFDIKPNVFNVQQRYTSGGVEYNPLMHKKMVVQQQQQGIIDELYKASDLIQNGNNPILAQGILARLNHQISPIGKPFERAAFYFKEALTLLVNSIISNVNPQLTQNVSPFSLIYKIGAYKSFSEISPFVQFANFTCNQALLESLNGYDHIHIIDFDIGYGGQWSSLMQELALRSNGVSSLKITAFASPLTHDQLELGLTRENLIHFANEINVGFDFDIVNIDVLAGASWSLPFSVSDNEAIAVNLPIHVLSNHQTQIPNVLRFVKNLNPKIVVSVDRGCDRTDLPYSNHLIHALQSYSNLLESLDAVNANLDSLQKIERFLVQPAIEKIVLGRFLYPEKTQHWRSLFLSAGFSPLLFSNFTESQAECLVKRTPVREFHVEKRQSLLVLCWQRRELVSASAWRC